MRSKRIDLKGASKNESKLPPAATSTPLPYFYHPRERMVYKLLRVAFRSEEVDVVEVGNLRTLMSPKKVTDAARGF